VRTHCHGVPGTAMVCSSTADLFPRNPLCGQYDCLCARSVHQHRRGALPAHGRGHALAGSCRTRSMSSSCMLDQAVASILRYSIMPGWSWLSQAGGKHAMPVGMLLVPHRTCRAAHKARCAGATFAQYVTQGGSCAQQGRKTGERPGFQAESQRAAARLIALRRELHKASKPAAAPADAQARSELERAALPGGQRSSCNTGMWSSCCPSLQSMPAWWSRLASPFGGSAQHVCIHA